MASSILGLSNYRAIFSSPVKPYQVNPVTNLMYGYNAGNLYSKSVARKAQSELSSYLTSLNTTAAALKTSAKSLAAEGPKSSFEQKAVASVDSSAVTGTAAWNAEAKTHTIKVTALASGQTNQGTAVKGDESSIMAKGVHSFNLKVGSTTRTLSFTVEDGDSNRKALDKMAGAINRTSAGISASVVSDSVKETSYLKITSNNTGKNSAFTLEDVSGNAVAASGAGNVQEQARDAEYSLDGKQTTSETNTLRLDNDKVTLTLKKAENKEIKFDVGADTKSIESDIRGFVENYNKAVRLSDSYSETFAGAQKLRTELTELLGSRRYSLGNIGINSQNDGTLTIDEKKLSKAIQENHSYVKDVFSGHRGVADRAYDKASEVLQAPMKYSKPELVQRDYNSFYNYLQASNKLNAQQNLYGGMIVDMLL